jgi:pimeloyl-[acyl-carrier protein] methyl ester esterase
MSEHPAAEPARTPPLTVVLLPGLDGTGLLFRRFIDAAPPAFAPRIIPLPQAGDMSYEGLARLMAPSLPEDRPFVLLGESFAGPLALALARRAPKGLVAVVLCVTFVEPPAWSWLRHFVSDLAFSMRPPGLGFRLVLAGRHTSADLLLDLQAARRAGSPSAMAARLREALRVDARSDLIHCPVPVLALHGGEDRLVWRGAVRAMRRARPDLPEVILPGPHMLLQTLPRECWNAIEAFVGTLPAPTR